MLREIKIASQKKKRDNEYRFAFSRIIQSVCIALALISVKISFNYFSYMNFLHARIKIF